MIFKCLSHAHLQRLCSRREERIVVIAIFGESCTGKSTIAERLKNNINATVYTGGDYLRLAKNETDAKKYLSLPLKNVRNRTRTLFM